MRLLHTFVSLLFTTLVYGQSIQYQATFLDPCSNKTEDLLYRLVKDSTSYYPKGMTAPYAPCELPDTGTYLLYAGSSQPLEVIKIQKTGLHIDTIVYAPITTTTSKSTDSKVQYWCCQALCNGLQTTFYKNGYPRFRGYFRNGQLVDTLKEYYYTGKIARIYHPINQFEQYYYFEGQLKKEIDHRKKHYTYYYPSGQVWLTYKKTNKGRKNIKQYYEAGQPRLIQKKKSKKGFYKNGKLAYQFKRSDPFWYTRLINKDEFRFYSYKYKAYNKQGILVQEATFTGADFDYTDGFPDKFSEIPVTELDMVIYYDNSGKKIKKEEYNYQSNRRIKRKTYIYENKKWEALKEVSIRIK